MRSLLPRTRRVKAAVTDRGDRSGVFRLIADPHTSPCCPECGRWADQRSYPDLDPPASFFDCWFCHLTWERGR